MIVLVKLPSAPAAPVIFFSTLSKFIAIWSLCFCKKLVNLSNSEIAANLSVRIVKPELERLEANVSLSLCKPLNITA